MKYSLESEEFKNIESNLNNFFNDFYNSKRKIKLDPERDKVHLLKEFNKSPNAIKRFLHEYDMGFLERGNKFIFTAELTHEMQQYVIYVSQFQCSKSSNLKPAYTIQGKNAEAITMCAFNNYLNYFRVDNKLRLNTKSFRYGGDGGYDFTLGKYRFDVKYRDDGPNHGLILRDYYLDRAEDDIILIFVTNSTNIKLGTKFSAEAFKKPFDELSSHLQEQVLPLSLTGWITVGEYKKKKKPRGGDYGVWVVDNLHPIKNLFSMVMEDQILSEQWFDR